MCEKILGGCSSHHELDHLFPLITITHNHLLRYILLTCGPFQGQLKIPGAKSMTIPAWLAVNCRFRKLHQY